MSSSNINKKELLKQLKDASKLKNNIGNLWSSVLIIKEIIKDYCSGAYAINSIVLMCFSAALVYLINPLDLIPDAIAVVGYSDDAAVIFGTLQQFSAEISAFKLWKLNQNKIKQPASQDSIIDIKEDQVFWQYIENKNYTQDRSGKRITVEQTSPLRKDILQEIKYIKRHYQRLILVQKINMEQKSFRSQEWQKKMLIQIEKLENRITSNSKNYNSLLSSLRDLKKQIDYVQEGIVQTKINAKILKAFRDRIQSSQKDLQKKNNRPYFNFVLGFLLTMLLLYM